MPSARFSSAMAAASELKIPAKARTSAKAAAPASTISTLRTAMNWVRNSAAGVGISSTSKPSSAGASRSAASTSSAGPT